MTDEIYSKPPPRLVDDPAVAPELQDGLTEIAATQLPFDTGAGLSSLQEVIGSSAHVGSSTVATTSISTGALVGGSVALIVIGAGMYAWLAPANEAPTLKTPAPIAAPAPAAPPAVAAPEAVVSRDPPPSPIKEAPPAATSAQAPLDREVAAMVRAKALVDQNPRAALALLRRLEREHPRGALSEERAGLRVLALWAAGEHDAAKTERDAFLARHPQSPMRERLSQLEAP